MSSVPTNNQAVFWAAITTFKLSGVTYPAIADITLKWGYKIHEEVTTGTNTPYLGTGVFHGEADIVSLGSSDSRFENAITIASGIVPTFGMTWQERDTQGLTLSGQRTWTISGKFTEYEKKTQKDQVVTYKLKCVMSNEPTVVQS